MIIDDISHAMQFSSINTRMETALRYLQETDLQSLPTGKIQLDGNYVYANVQEFTTRKLIGGSWEAHRRYIDVHSILEGEEKIGYAPVKSLHAGDYIPEKDFIPLEGEGDYFHLRPGYFAIMMPEDAHQPGLAAAEPQRVRKIVIKVAI